jgi:hypothetical protein
VCIFVGYRLNFIRFKETTYGHNLFNKEAEYMVGNSKTFHAVWLRRILSDLANEEKEPTLIFFGYILAIALSKNHVFHRNSKHSITSYHFIHNLVNDGRIMLHFRGSKEQLAISSPNHWEEIFL